jgi:hypothetical protein
MRRTYNPILVPLCCWTLEENPEKGREACWTLEYIHVMMNGFKVPALSCCSCIFQPINHIRSALAQSFNLHMTRTIWKKNNSPSPCHLKRDNIQKRHNWKKKWGPKSTLHAYPALSNRVGHCHGVLASIFSWVQKLAQMWKFQKKSPNIPCFLGKKFPNCLKKKKYKQNSPHFRLGFFWVFWKTS